MKFSSYLASAASLSSLAGQVNAALQLDLTSDASIKKAASTAAFDMMAYYTGNRTGDTPGNLPDPYYWWEAGAMFNSMINYWYYTRDTTYNDVVMQALLHQVGDDLNYMPQNQTRTLGNDDQAFWGMAAMAAAETNFANPPKDKPQWLALAQGVFNSQALRWSTEACGGGLRWQIFPFNSGYGYKNSISNGCFFNLASRLALYTGNQTYADWADKTWDWMERVQLMTSEYEIFDGSQSEDNCTAKDHNQWTYNNGIFIMGAAAMFNFTEGSAKWRARVDGMTSASKKFFQDDIMYEPCEPVKCNVDQRSFKAYFTRSLAATAKLAPYTHDNIIREIRTSATAAIKTCTAGNTQTQCGLKWTTGVNDGSLGVGEQMAVLEIIQSNLVDKAPAWASDRAGTGTSEGNVNAGTGSGRDGVNGEELQKYTTVTMGDKVGAGFLTALMLAGVIGGTATMMIAE